jgi:hypothetical protein
MGNSYSCGGLSMAIRIPLVQINGRVAEMPATDKFDNKVISSYIFEQVLPATTWLIQHNMDKFPAVTITLTDNTEIQGFKKYLDSNTVELSFSKPISGKAFLN